MKTANKITKVSEDNPCIVKTTPGDKPEPVPYTIFLWSRCK